MRIALYILLTIHGLIHLFGFFKAFGIAEFTAINQPISKPMGLLWLLAFLLFAFTIALLSLHQDFWWLCGFVAVLVSQFLIIGYWSDAKFGTIANAMVLLAAIIGYADFGFQSKIEKERSELLSSANTDDEERISKADLTNLPPIVQKWLSACGAIGKAKVNTVYLKQDLLLKLKPDQDEWSRGSADQFFSVSPPAFNWKIEMKMNSFLPVSGRDRFHNGKGEMLIKLFSLIPVADAKNEAKVDQATLQRFLAEIVWFPSAALSDYIEWEERDETSAKATMTYKGIEGSGIFHFDENGQFVEFVAMRYKDASDAEPGEWRVESTASEVRNGMRIPTACEASWVENGEKQTWLKLTVAHIEYGMK